MRWLFLLVACNHDPLATPQSIDAAFEGGFDAALSSACASQLWTTGCCPGGSECAACTVPQFCSAISVDCCPLDRCQLMTDCAGQPVCYNQLQGTRPACGGVSYYGQDVSCCAGLVKRCGKPLADGSCDPGAGYNHLPQCLACGDGSCDAFFENRCNCPEDCP